MKKIHLLEEFKCNDEWSEEIDRFPVYGISVLIKFISFLINGISFLINELFPYENAATLLLSGLVDILWTDSILLDAGFRSCWTALKKKIKLYIIHILLK